MKDPDDPWPSCEMRDETPRERLEWYRYIIRHQGWMISSERCVKCERVRVLMWSEDEFWLLAFTFGDTTVPHCGYPYNPWVWTTLPARDRVDG